jgi:hypothetical protein
LLFNCLVLCAHCHQAEHTRRRNARLLRLVRLVNTCDRMLKDPVRHHLAALH